MDQHNIVILAYRDSELLLNTFALIEILKENISKLEYTGEFHSRDNETCEFYIDSLRKILMKKLIEIE
jgi:hypothetical protein